jgi:hypothetical protein
MFQNPVRDSCLWQSDWSEMTGPENGVVADEPDGVEEAIRKPKKRSRIVRWKAYISFMLIKLAGRTLKHMLGMNVAVVNRQAVPKTRPAISP